MATPNMSVRVPLEYQGLVRAVVNRLKTDTSFAAVLQSALDTGRPEPPEDLADRVVALEEELAHQRDGVSAVAETLATMHASLKRSLNQRVTLLEDRIGDFLDRYDPLPPEVADEDDEPDPLRTGYDEPEDDGHPLRR